MNKYCICEQRKGRDRVRVYQCSGGGDGGGLPGQDEKEEDKKMDKEERQVPSGETWRRLDVVVNSHSEVHFLLGHLSNCLDSIRLFLF